MKLLKYILILVGISALGSCQKEDVAVTLPEPGNLSNAVANIGSGYNNQVYFDFGTGKQTTVSYRSYDLAFESSANGFRIYLNTGKLMFACHTGTPNFTSADTTGRTWVTDNNQLNDDSTAIGNWQTNDEVIVIDRGRVEHSGADRWRKIRIISVSNIQYIVEYQPYTASQPITIHIPKSEDYSLVYFSFDNNGEVVNVAPPKNEWDVVFTKFTHTYFDEPANSPYKYYLVTGAILNKWNNEKNTAVIKDTTFGYIPFTDITSSKIGTYQFTDNATVIGFDWKYFDFNSGYVIYPDRFYLLSDENGFYYKIRFIDFYDSSGNKGAITFEYQRL
jgi:heme-binding HmuY-like protein